MTAQPGVEPAYQHAGAAGLCVYCSVHFWGAGDVCADCQRGVDEDQAVLDDLASSLGDGFHLVTRRSRTALRAALETLNVRAKTRCRDFLAVDLTLSSAAVLVDRAAFAGYYSFSDTGQPATMQQVWVEPQHRLAGAASRMVRDFLARFERRPNVIIENPCVPMLHVLRSLGLAEYSAAEAAAAAVDRTAEPAHHSDGWLFPGRLQPLW